MGAKIVEKYNKTINDLFSILIIISIENEFISKNKKENYRTFVKNWFKNEKKVKKITLKQRSKIYKLKRKLEKNINAKSKSN